MLSVEDRQIIRGVLSGKLRAGELSLLLGAGFSRGNEGGVGQIPGSSELIDAILAEAVRLQGPRPSFQRGERTNLKDVYVLGDREIPQFPEFLSELFTVSKALPWQQKLFAYAWRRIYTTNIDNVLNVARDQQERTGRLGGDFKFFNYSDQSLASESIGSIPVVTIHGTCSRIEDGFIFSNVEYAIATAKVQDWHRDLAARALTGGLLVVGNQLEESDLDAHIAARKIAFGVGASKNEVARNWIVLPDPDPIKSDNYRAAGYHVFNATAEEFFSSIFELTEPRTIGEIVLDTVPSVRSAATNQRAMTWFGASMTPVLTAIESAQSERGLLRHFITGDDPEWFYIVNSAHAETSRDIDLTAQIGDLLARNANGVGVLHVLGPSGSGKTTTIRAALHRVAGSIPYIYEFNNESSIDPDLLKETISRFTEKSVFVFYSASEFYYAISYIADHFRGKRNPFCLFILEDRSGEYGRNKGQLKRADVSERYTISDLNEPDAESIARKIEEHGLVVDGFSNLPLNRRASLIVDKERGYSGDLLTTLFSLTTHENFEAKIHDDYFSIKSPLARAALEAVSIVNSLGINLPLHYVAGFLDISQHDFQAILEADLAGVLVYSAKQGHLRCRHRIVADYYFNQCISKHGSSELILNVLRFLSRQFAVADIRNHPLPYRIYKEIVSFEFLYDRYFANGSRLNSTEAVYHEAQSMFGTDGIFWLHFGRFYRKTGRLDEAIECFRTGLSYFESYQTRHQLGVALLERYMERRCSNREDYEEGIATLERERVARGSTDAFPVGTMIDNLRKIIRLDSANEDAVARLRECFNFAMRHFKEDAFIRDQVAAHFNRNNGR